jgi:hypothetical protein
VYSCASGGWFGPLTLTVGRDFTRENIFMRTTFLLLAVLSPVLIGCSATRSSLKGHPETVLVTYHVQPGKEAEFLEVLSQAWELYRREHLVFAQPHIVVQDTEDGSKPRFAEVFTWSSRSIPAHAPESVKAIGKQEESLCEKRGEHNGIEPVEVELLVPRR